MGDRGVWRRCLEALKIVKLVTFITDTPSLNVVSIPCWGFEAWPRKYRRRRAIILRSGGVVLFRTSRKAPSGLEGRGFPHTLKKARSSTVPYKEAYARDFKKFVRQPTLARIY